MPSITETGKKNSPVSPCKSLLADIARLIKSDGCEIGEILNMLSKRRWVEDEYSTAMPEVMTPMQFIEAMIVAGVMRCVDKALTIRHFRSAII